MTEVEQQTPMEIDVAGSNQSLQLPWVEKYRPKR